MVKKPREWRNLENEEAKARYGAVENATTMDCNAKKTNKQERLVVCLVRGIDLIFKYYLNELPVPVAARSKT